MKGFCRAGHIYLCTHEALALCDLLGPPHKRFSVPWIPWLGLLVTNARAQTHTPSHTHPQTDAHNEPSSHTHAHKCTHTYTCMLQLINMQLTESSIIDLT